MGVLLGGNNEYASAAVYTRPSTDHTVSYWLRLDNASGISRPFGCTGLWEARTNGSTGFLTSDYLQSGTLGNVTLTVGTYHHVAFVQDVTNTDRFAYLDGVLVNTITTATFAGQQSGTLFLGRSPGGGVAQSWFGAIDDVRIYDRVMTGNEIATIYACRGQDGILDNLQHHWPLDEGAEGAATVTLVDVVGGLNFTTMVGTPVYNYDAGVTQLVA